jgi:hypothetical protein
MHAPSSGVDTQREGDQKLPLWTRCIERRAQHSGLFWGVFVTREHVRHNKSGIAHRGRTGINH